MKPGLAQVMCAERNEIVKGLENKFSESPSSLGLVDNGNIVEVFVSDEKQTFTIILTRPNGQSCLITAGTHWEKVIKEISGAGI